MPLTATVTSSADALRQEILVNERHRLATDEPAELGGTDTAPTPEELLPAALAACVATTIRMFARRQGWALGEVRVAATLDTRARPQRCALTVTLPHGLSEAQWRRLEYVARACSVHRALEQSVAVEQALEFAQPSSTPSMPEPRGPLPEEEFHRIFSRVPRLTVEVVIAGAGGVLLTLREAGPCKGLWHIPGGTVRFGERLTEAVERVARDELGLRVRAGALLDCIEYPSHFEHGLDCPVGLAFEAVPVGDAPAESLTRRWFARPPANMHEEQRAFLARHVLREGSRPT